MSKNDLRLEKIMNEEVDDSLEDQEIIELSSSSDDNESVDSMNENGDEASRGNFQRDISLNFDFFYRISRWKNREPLKKGPMEHPLDLRFSARLRKAQSSG